MAKKRSAKEQAVLDEVIAELPGIEGFVEMWEENAEMYDAILDVTDIPEEPWEAVGELIVWSMYKAGANPLFTARLMKVLARPLQALFCEGYRQGVAE